MRILTDLLAQIQGDMALRGIIMYVRELRFFEEHAVLTLPLSLQEMSVEATETEIITEEVTGGGQGHHIEDDASPK